MTSTPKIEHTIKLTAPITLGERTIDNLSFRSPKIKDLKGMSSADDVESSIKLVSRLTAEPETIIGEISINLGAFGRDGYLAFRNE